MRGVAFDPVRHHLADFAGRDFGAGHGSGVLPDVAANLDRVGAEIGLDIARTQHRDADAVAGHLAPQLLTQGRNAELGHRIGPNAGHRGDQPGLRGGQHDLAAAACGKVGGESEDAVGDAAQIDRQDAVEALRVHLGKRPAIGRNPGVEDQHVDRPEGGLRFGLGPCPGIAVAHIEHHPAKTVAARADDFGNRFGVDVGNGHRHAARAKRVGHAQSQPAGAAGDEGVLCRCEVHDRSLPWVRQAPPSRHCL